MTPSITAPLVANPSTTVLMDVFMLGLMPSEQSPKRNDIGSMNNVGLGRQPRVRVPRGTLGDDDDDSDTHAAARYFACPFYKFDPKKHFRCFRKYDLHRYSDVKQHIVRRHSLSPLYCSNCWTSFSDNKEYEYRQHLETGNCSKQPISEDLFPHEVAALNNLVLNGPGRRASDSSRWFSAWDLLFPGHSRPSSPYVEEGPVELCTLLTSSSHALRGVLPSLLDSLGVSAGQETTALLAQQIHELYTRSLAAEPADSRRRLEFLASASRNTSWNVTGPSTQPDGPSELVDT
ncbi:hypothetical protein PWT90_04641 [Aphanocladium album]|nr:hypothetical protein PWT90_04641 [Aphanocladium album]